MTVWASLSAGQSFRGNLRGLLEKVPTLFAQHEVLQVQWPGPRFRPHAIGCGGGRVFAADQYNIFEIFPNSLATAIKVPCPGLQGPIVEVSVSCEDGQCTPVVLTRGAGGDGINNCTGQAPILGNELPVEHFTIAQASPAMRQLWAIHKENMVQYGWDTLGPAWRAESSMGGMNFLQEVTGIAISGNRLMLLNLGHGIEPHVAVISVEGRGILDRLMLQGDASFASSICALSDQMLLLLRGDFQHRELMKVTLK